MPAVPAARAARAVLQPGEEAALVGFVPAGGVVEDLRASNGQGRLVLRLVSQTAPISKTCGNKIYITHRIYPYLGKLVLTLVVLPRVVVASLPPLGFVEVPG